MNIAQGNIPGSLITYFDFTSILTSWLHYGHATYLFKRLDSIFALSATPTSPYTARRYHDPLVDRTSSTVLKSDAQ